MIQYLQNLLKAMRPAFSREATFGWFVVTVAGFVVRSDTFGVSSIVRALWLEPIHYSSLLHFFHSSAWSGDELLRCWRQWLAKENRSYKVAGRVVMIGDHTKLPKDGRRIPAVDTLHQDSETATKPSFFRGHHWGFLGLLMHSGQRFFAAPVWGEIHQGKLHGSRTTRIVTVAGNIAREINSRAYLVLDAFFAVGPVFETAEKFDGWIHILTRAKKNVVAYMAPPRTRKSGPGRRQIYGKKLKLQKLFEQWSHKFTTAQTKVYHKKETVRYLTLDLIWKPVKTKLRFILIETSRGRIILMTSDLTLQPLTALNLYCRRVNIETLFDVIKNLLGGMRYHFWSKYLTPASRRPAKKGTPKPTSSRPSKTKNTIEAIEKFLHVQLVVVGALQLIAYRFAPQISAGDHCWLRTPCGKIPSVFVTRTALANAIRTNLISFAPDWITQLILKKQSTNKNSARLRKAA
jgi:DDE superfamily endonuclease